MDLSAILLVGERSLAESGGRLDVLPQSESNGRDRVPLASLEIFGKSVIERALDRLQRVATGPISVIAGPGCHSLSRLWEAGTTIREHQQDRWAAAEHMLRKYAQLGLRTVLIAEVGAYVELDCEKAVAFHVAQQQPLTPIYDKSGALGYWIADAASITSNRGFRLPLSQEAGAVPFLVSGYVNRLSDARDLRRFVVDAFHGRCSITPPGREVKPGVWVDQGASLHKNVRLVAPVYLGRNANVRSAAVVTKFSNVERNSQVGEGSVVANASVLPHTIIGSGLDVTNAVVSGHEFVDLHRNVTLSIQDPNLISDAARKRERVSGLSSEFATDQESSHTVRPLEPEYSSYLSRAAGRLLEVFRDEA